MKQGKPVLGNKSNHPMKAATLVRAGMIACLQGGLVVEGVEADDLTTLGAANETVDNSSGANGDLSIDVSREKFGFYNDGSIDQTHIGQTVYVVDANTLSASDNASARSAAGKLFALQGDLAIINFGA